jgi:hypothetical protein
MYQVRMTICGMHPKLYGLAGLLLAQTGPTGSERQQRALCHRCCDVFEWLLSPVRQNPSTTVWVLNGVCGSEEPALSKTFQKGEFLEHALNGGCANIVDVVGYKLTR